MTKHLKFSACVLICVFLIVYSFAFVEIFKGPWSTDANAHGPMLLALSIWFLIRQLYRIKNKIELVDFSKKNETLENVVGWMFFLFGLALYVIGFSQNVYFMSALSFSFVCAGITLLASGFCIFRKIWFAFILMLFMVPLPVLVIDALTLPMKSMVSWCVEYILYGFGYPVSRQGVVISLGQYKLLVADACSGLNSLFVLEALGLLYLNLIRHESFTRNLLLGILIIPISFSANVVRVLALSLITFYYGDAAGQGFLHNLAGFVLFGVALSLIILSDTAIRLFLKLLKNKYSEVT